MKEIYAELSKSTLRLIEEGKVTIPILSGVHCFRKKGSRTCYISIDEDLSEEDQKSLLVEMTDNLDSLGINWQDM